MFDKKSFEDGIELGKRLGKSEALLRTWLHDLPQLKTDIITALYDVDREEFDRSSACDSVLKLVQDLSDKVNQEHNELRGVENNEQV